jgi:hypothetical protein
MGFGAGGGGALPNHEHTNIALDGGPLDFNNTTVGSMNAGDITFSDGAALQQLAYPAVPAGETLTAAALSSAPAWTAAAAGVNNRVILDSQTFTASTTSTITFTPATPIDDSVYQKIQIVFTGNGLGNSIDRAMFRLDSGLTNTNYNENSIELFNGILQLMNRNPQSAGDDYVRLTDQLANGGEGWIITIDLQIPPSGQTATSLLYQVSNHDRVAIGSGWVTGIAASVITRIQIDLQNGTNNKDMQFTVYGIKF